MSTRDSQIVSRPSPFNSGQDLSLSQAPSEIQFQAIYDKIRTIRSDPHLPFGDRRTLIKTQVQTLIRLEQKQLGATEEAAVSAIFANLEEFKLKLRARFVEIFAKFGRQVDDDSLNFFAEFGEQITRFKELLKGRKIEPWMQEQIATQADAAFRRMIEKVATLTADIIATVSGGSAKWLSF